MVWLPPHAPVLCLAGAVPMAASLAPSSAAPDMPGRLGGSGKDLGVAADTPGRGIAGWDRAKSP